MQLSPATGSSPVAEASLRNEQSRVASLARHTPVDRDVVRRLDDLVSVAAYVCATPTAAVTLVGADRVSVVSAVGAGTEGWPSVDSFCRHVVISRELVEVHDARSDQRFADAARRLARAGVRFYAGVPITDVDGHVLGALCVADVRPRRLDPGQREVLQALGRQAAALFDSSLDARERSTVLRQLEHALADLQSAHASLQQSETSFRAMFHTNPHPMWVYDRETLRFLEVNDAAIQHYGWSREEFLTMTIRDIRPEDELARFDRLVRSRAGGEYGYRGRWQHRRAAGDLIEVEVTSHPLTFQGRAAAMVLVLDVTERQRSQEIFEALTRCDALTGLVNRSVLLEELASAITRVHARPPGLALLFCDLDRFKVINDSLGHSAGDELLVAMARRIGAAVRPGDVVARLGGDEFVVLAEGVGADGAMHLAENVQRAVREPVTIAGRELVMSASIGVALTGNAHDAADRLLRDADTAMYRAKDRGRARCELFDDALLARAVARLDTETELRRAIDRDELLVHYQSIVDLRSGCVTGLEALARWRHPERGLVGPTEFIAVAEHSGLIIPLGRAVLDQACREAAQWQRTWPAGPPPRVSVNLSGHQLARADLVATVATSLAEAELDPCCVSLEITESVLMEDTRTTIRSLSALRELGVAVAIDDFGTGYSSLAYLKRLPVDAVKIDRSFVSGLGSPDAPGADEDAAIVSAVIALGHALGLTVVAEGVEDEETLDRLRAMECDAAQGFVLSRPQPPAELSRLVASDRR